MRVSKSPMRHQLIKTELVRAIHSYMSTHLCLAPYVKVYLLENGACIAKKKTRIARKTLDPLYQQSLVFDESPQGKVLQVSNTFLDWLW